MTNATKLITLTRIYVEANQKFTASATQGRFNAMKAAQANLVAELEKWPAESLPAAERGLF